VVIKKKKGSFFGIVTLSFLTKKHPFSTPVWWFFITCGGHLVHSETLATASLTTSRQSTASARKHKGKIANGVKKNKSDKVFQIFSTNWKTLLTLTV
jgi:hypothetical protein